MQKNTGDKRIKKIRILATSPANIPLKTSPLPAVAIAGVPLELKYTLPWAEARAL